MGGKRLDYMGDEGKALAFLAARGYSPIDIQKITRKSVESVIKAVELHSPSSADIYKEVGRRIITRNGYLESSVAYLHEIGKKSSEISEYIGISKTSVNDILARRRAQSSIKSNKSETEESAESLHDDCCKENAAKTECLPCIANEITTEPVNELVCETQAEEAESRQKLFVSFTKSNYDFISVWSLGYGINKTAAINLIVGEFRKAHSQDAEYQEALDIAEKVAARRAAAGYEKGG